LLDTVLGARDDEENLSVHSLSSLREHLVEGGISVVGEENNCGSTFAENGLDVILREFDHCGDSRSFQPLANAINSVGARVVDGG